MVYKFQRGCSWSSFLFNCVLTHHIEQNKEEDPEFADKLVGGFLVDDLVAGCRDIQEALTLYEKAKMRLKDGRFILRKWKPNKKELAKEIAHRECEIRDEENTRNEEQYLNFLNFRPF